MIHYVRQGSGKTLVLVHGFLGSSEVFHSMVDDLSHHFDCIAIDLPGHGKSAVEQDAYTVQTYAQEVVKVLEKEKVESANWLGHSLGGYVVLSALAENYAKIPKAILLHSAVNVDDEVAKEKRTKQQQAIGADGVEKFVEEIMPNFFAKSSSPKLTDQARDIANEASKEGLVLALDAMKSRPSRQSFIDETQTPILIIEGTEDKVVKPIQTNNPNVEKAVVESGHMGMLEDLDGVLSAIYTFLK